MLSARRPIISDQATQFRQFIDAYGIDPFHIPPPANSPKPMFNDAAIHDYCHQLGMPDNIYIFTHSLSERYLNTAHAEILYLYKLGALTKLEAEAMYRISYGILANETYFGHYKSLRLRAQAAPSKSALITLGKLGRHISIGLTQMKVTLLFDSSIVNDKRFLTTDFWLPEQAARWTVLSVAMYARLYDSQEDMEVRLLCCHNMGPAAMTWDLEELLDSSYTLRTAIVAKFLQPIVIK